MNKVTAGQLRLLGCKIYNAGSRFEQGTPYLVLSRVSTEESYPADPAWHCMVGNNTIKILEEDIKTDRLVVQH